MSSGRKLDFSVIKNILVINMGGIGDILVFSPVLKTLREEFPGRRIVLMIAEPGVADLIKGNGFFDEILLLDRTKKQSFIDQLRFIVNVRRHLFDLAVIAAGTNSLKAALLTYLANIPHRVGENTGVGRFLYTIKSSYDSTLPEFVRNFNLVKAMGKEVTDTKPMPYISKEDEMVIEKFLSENELLNKTLIAIHLGPAGKGKEFKRWPLKNFIELMDKLAENYLENIIIIGGQKELELAYQTIKSVKRAKPIIAAGKFSINQTAALIKKCNILITSDSGPMHIAAAVDTPMVVIYGPTNPKTSRPNTDNYTIVRNDLKSAFDAVYERLSSNELDSRFRGNDNPKKRKYKIAHIITTLNRGGSSQNTLLNCIGLDKTTFEVTLMAGSTEVVDQNLMAKAKSSGVDVIFIPALKREINVFYDVMAFFRIYSILKKKKFDLVHAHSSKAGLIGRVAAKISHVPVIIHTPHGHVFYGYFNQFLTGIFIFIEKFAARFTDKIITLTQTGKDEWIKFGIAKEDKFIAIHSGICFDPFLKRSFDIIQKRKELNISDKARIILTAGRLVPVKGHKYFIGSIPKILGVFQDAVFIIVGDGPEKTTLEKQARSLGVADKVKFLGWKADLYEILAIADIFVLPSLNEGMGRVLVEAMVLAKPVVAARVGGIPDIVIDNYTGMLVPSADPDALAEQIVKLLKDGDRAQKIGLQAKEHVLSHFSADEMVNKIQGLYERCLKDKAGA